MPELPKKLTVAQPGFAQRVLLWQQRHGRHDLPWQASRDPYAVWLSEVMLQQTQVATVRDYFARFIYRFPTVQALGQAPLDDVLALWSGLGYYRRARMLHQCAQQIVGQHGGAFPRTARALQELPGIGRSTAAAIASLCFSERVAILDGNVKRVLTRVMAFGHDLAQPKHERALWDWAEQLLPNRDIARAMPLYTQGMMDLGATVCLARNPLCGVCPLRGQCLAYAEAKVERYPVKNRTIKRIRLTLWMLQAFNAAGDVWLVKRPAGGIWGGLFCLPVFDSREALQGAVGARAAKRLLDAPSFTHVLTHRDLQIHPVRLDRAAAVPGDLPGAWRGIDTLAAIGLPAPVRKLLTAGPL